MRNVSAVTVCVAFLILSVVAGCQPRISLLGDTASDPLKEYTLEGQGLRKGFGVGSGKVLVIPIQGFIGLGAHQGLLRSRPGVVQEVTAMLRKAEKDASVKAVVLVIDSPGGAVADTDMLYRELMDFKARRQVKIVAQAMSVTASGGYYLALSADDIAATPASVVGSVGTVFIAPKLAGLMDKIGVEAEVTKSGALKDMGSPFRPSTEEERRLAQQMIDQMNALFQSLLASTRKLDAAALAEVGRAGVYTGQGALDIGLVDRLGYMRDSLAKAKSLAGLPDDARVVVYKRSKYNNDTYYNTASGEWGGDSPKMLNLGLENIGLGMRAGFYYLWPPAMGGLGQ